MIEWGIKFIKTVLLNPIPTNVNLLTYQLSFLDNKRRSRYYTLWWRLGLHHTLHKNSARFIIVKALINTLHKNSAQNHEMTARLRHLTAHLHNSLMSINNQHELLYNECTNFICKSAIKWAGQHSRSYKNKFVQEYSVIWFKTLLKLRCGR